MDAKIKNLNFLPAPTGGKVTVALTGDRNQVSVTVPGSLSEVEAHKAFRLDRSRHTATVEAMTELAGELGPKAANMVERAACGVRSGSLRALRARVDEEGFADGEALQKCLDRAATRAVEKGEDPDLAQAKAASRFAASEAAKLRQAEAEAASASAQVAAVMARQAIKAAKKRRRALQANGVKGAARSADETRETARLVLAASGK